MREGSLGFVEQCKLKDELRRLENAFNILQYSNSEVLGCCRLFKKDKVECVLEERFFFTEDFGKTMREYVATRIKEIKSKLGE